MSLEQVDWSRIPEPEDDGAAWHLVGLRLPSVELPATNGARTDLSALSGTLVVYAYPMTGRPDTPLPEGWDMIPGARGCTPQSCAFRDHDSELRAAGADAVLGLSTQSTAYQKEATERLHLPFPILSDKDCAFADAVGLPTMIVRGTRLLRRLTMVIRDGVIVRVHYPVFPPDQDASRVLAWLRENPQRRTTAPSG